MSRHADPYNRCQQTGEFGQCPNPKVAGQDFCERHGGIGKANKAERRMYDLAQAELRGLYGKMADREDLLSLRGEVALVRMTIQRFADLMNTNDSSFESKITTFNNLLMTAKSLVDSCVKVEKSAGLTVDRAALLQFAAEAVQICSEEVDGLPNSEDVMERIASRLVDAVKAAGETEDAEASSV